MCAWYVWSGEVEVGSYIYSTSSSSFQKPSKKPGDSVGVRVKKDETLGINHHQFTGGYRKCERQIFTNSPGPWKSSGLQVQRPTFKSLL